MSSSSSILKVQTLLIKTTDDTIFKRLKRKLNKPSIALDIKATTKQDLSQILTHALKKNAQSNSNSHLHVYLDKQTLLFDIYTVPEPLLVNNLPPSWDFLCLQSNVKSYDNPQTLCTGAKLVFKVLSILSSMQHVSKM